MANQQATMAYIQGREPAASQYHDPGAFAVADSGQAPAGDPGAVPNPAVVAALSKMFLAGLPNGITKMGFAHDESDAFIEVEQTADNSYEVWLDGELHAVVGMSVQYYEPAAADMDDAMDDMDETVDNDVPVNEAGIVVAEPVEGMDPGDIEPIAVPDLTDLSKAPVGKAGDSEGSVNKKAKAKASKEGEAGAKKKSPIKDDSLGA